MPSALPRLGGRVFATAGYYAIFIGLGLVYAALGPTLPGLAAGTASSLAAISYLFTARSVGYLTGAFVAGSAYDRRPGHPILANALLVMAIAMVAIPFVGVLVALVAVVYVLGLGEGLADIGTNTLIVWVHGERVGPWMNALHFFFGVGAIVAPIVVAKVMEITGGITWSYVLLGLVLVPIALVVGRIRSPAPPSHHVDASPPRTDRRLVVIVAAFLFLYVGAEAGYGGWIYTYAIHRGLATASSAAYLTSAFWMAFTVGRFLAIPLSIRFRPRTMLAADLLGGFLALAAIAYRPESREVMWGATCLMGLSLASIFPTTLNLAERRMTFTSRVTSWFFIGASMGGMVLPFIVGQFFDSFGPGTLTMAMFVDLLLATVVFAAMIDRSERPDGRETAAQTVAL